MSNYGVVYKLSKNGKDYYGSTCMTMAMRMTKHREKNPKRKCVSEELFIDGDPNITLLECIIFKNIKELREIEDKYIRNNPCLNKCGATFNRQEYEDKNREKTNKQQKERRKLKDMKEKIVCDNCGLSVNKNGIYRHKKTKKCMGLIKND